MLYFKKIVFPLILIIAITSSCKKNNFNAKNIGNPANVGNNQIVEHKAYTLSYNETHEQADWVAYELTKKHVEDTTFQRQDDFREDSELSSGSSKLADYEPTKSVYARGHLAPAADFRWSEDAMSESFFMSNMSPQLHAFNSGKWLALEKEVRHWAIIYNDVYVVTGGILKPDLPTIGNSNVSVPERFYKIIVDANEEKAIAFIMPNKDINDTFKNYAVTIDEVEDATGIDFFPELDDKLENKIESTLNMSKWNFDFF